MRARRQTPQQQEAISRRLALLSAELATVRTEPQHEAPEPEPWRPADPALAVAFRPWQESEVEHSSAMDSDLNRTLGVPAFPGRHAARRRGPSLAAALPDTVRRRWALGPAHMAVVAVIVTLCLAVTAWWAVRSRPTEVVSGDLAAPSLAAQALPTQSPLLDVAPEAGSPDPSGPAEPTEVIVDVSGKVRRPGIAVLEPGARVVDALKAAGGARPGADLGTLNLARLVIDGEQILVGLPQPAGVGAAAAAPSGTTSGGALVNINVADQPELETLPGIGPVTAQAIMAWRAEHNGFGAVEELLDVQGIGEATLAQLAPHVTI